MTEPKEEEKVAEKKEASKEVDNEEGKRYTGGPIPKISQPKQSKD